MEEVSSVHTFYQSEIKHFLIGSFSDLGKSLQDREIGCFLIAWEAASDDQEAGERMTDYM